MESKTASTGDRSSNSELVVIDADPASDTPNWVRVHPRVAAALRGCSDDDTTALAV